RRPSLDDPRKLTKTSEWWLFDECGRLPDGALGRGVLEAGAPVVVLERPDRGRAVEATGDEATCEGERGLVRRTQLIRRRSEPFQRQRRGSIERRLQEEN